MDLFPVDKYKDLVQHLSDIQINGHFNGLDGTKMSDVSSVLLRATLGERWCSLSDAQQKRQIKDSKKRLWYGYMRRLKGIDKTLHFGSSWGQKVAAEEAIAAEVDYLGKRGNLLQGCSST